MPKQSTKNVLVGVDIVTALFEKFEQKMDQRFEILEQKVDANHVETTDFFVAMKRDFDHLDDKFNVLDSKFTALDKKVITIDDRLANVEILCAKNEHHLHELDLNIGKRFDRLETVVFPKNRGRLSLVV